MNNFIRSRIRCGALSRLNSIDYTIPKEMHNAKCKRNRRDCRYMNGRKTFPWTWEDRPNKISFRIWFENECCIISAITLLSGRILNIELSLKTIISINKVIRIEVNLQRSFYFTTEYNIPQEWTIFSTSHCIKTAYRLSKRLLPSSGMKSAGNSNVKFEFVYRTFCRKKAQQVFCEGNFGETL